MLILTFPHSFTDNLRQYFSFWKLDLFSIWHQRRTLRSETIFGNWKPFKNDEECFLFHLEIFSRYLSFCLEFLVKLKNSFIRKIRLVLKIMTSQPDEQTYSIHILPNISRSKGNETIGQLLDNVRNIFVEKAYTKCREQTILRPFSKKLKLSRSLH